jgi:hypothetical protein
MTLFFASLLLMLGSSATALLLSYRLRAGQPELHRTLQIHPWARTPQFWVYHFLAPSKLGTLTGTDRSLAIASIVLLSSGLLGLGTCAVGFAMHGNL